MTTFDLGQRLAVAETRIEERHTEQMRRIGELELTVKEGFRRVEEKVDGLHNSVHEAEGRLERLETESRQYRRDIARLWRWGGGVGAGITGAAAALARWWS